MDGVVYRNSKKDQGWMRSRYTLAGRRIQPNTIWRSWKAGWTREKCAYEYRLTLAEVDTAIAWCEKRSAAAKRRA